MIQCFWGFLKIQGSIWGGWGNHTIDEHKENPIHALNASMFNHLKYFHFWYFLELDFKNVRL